MNDEHDSEGTYIGYMLKDANGDRYCSECREAPEGCVCCPYCGSVICEDCDDGDET